VRDADKIDLDERFEAMEKRISELEALVASLSLPKQRSDKPLPEIPKFDWKNHLGIATVYDIYSGKADL